jgi:hypothetical protein
MSVLKILGVFKENYILFIDDLLSIFPDDKDLNILKVLFVNQISTENIAQQFSMKVLPFENMIKNRDEKYFLEDDKIYREVKTEAVDKFKNIWKTGNIDKENKEMIWRWLDQFVILINKYIRILYKENNEEFQKFMSRVRDEDTIKFLTRKAIN